MHQQHQRTAPAKEAMKKDEAKELAERDAEAQAAAAPARQDDVEELLDESADLLDEIDAMLEENAEEFIRGYIQKGGQ